MQDKPKPVDFYRPAISVAAGAGNRDLVAALIAQGADVDERDFSAMTALMLAVWVGHEEVIHLLLSAGADVNAQTRAGRTVLDIAILTAAKKPSDAAERIREMLVKQDAKPLLFNGFP